MFHELSGQPDRSRSELLFDIKVLLLFRDIQEKQYYPSIRCRLHKPEKSSLLKTAKKRSLLLYSVIAELMNLINFKNFIHHYRGN